MSNIHPSAIISSKAEIDLSVEIGHNVFIDENVKIGAGSKIYANAYITGYCEIGKNNQIHIGAVIGHDPQDYAFDKSIKSRVEIGDDNIIREYSTIHRGTKPDTKTVIGSNNFLMGGVHIGHNCSIGSRVVFANYATLGGYVSVGDNAFISGGVVIHQFVSVGRLAMLSGNGRFSQDIPPFLTALERNSVESVNLVGMRRAGFSADVIKQIKELYSMYYLSGLLKVRAIEKMEASGFASPEALEFIEFIKGAKRPLATHRKRRSSEGDE